MTILIIVLVSLVVLAAASATFVVTGRRRRPPVVAPPKQTSVAPPASGPTRTPEAADPARAGPADAPTVGTAGDEAGSAVEIPEGIEIPDDLAGLAEALEETGESGDGDDVGGVETLERPRFRDRLGKARSLFSGYLTSVRGRDKIDQTTWEELEEALILADVGVDVATNMLDALRAKAKQENITAPSVLVDAFKADMVQVLSGDRELRVEPDVTNVWLFVGVNGVGKTTTIGKLGMRVGSEGRSVVMAAGDTFRAAAADQLTMWAERVGAEVVRGSEGGDPGSVIFDAVAHAAAKGSDLVLADTAGRLHTKVNLMEELKKVRRVADRPPGKVSEVLLVIDATTGQNGLIQAKQFAEAVEVTGVVLTKLDGTAKGGIALAIAAELGIPIKLVGLGEAAGDLIDFDAAEFVDALVDPD